jgi:DnaJ domain
MVSGAVDYYAVLGLKKDATSSQIKTAYHAAAKKAHPDAGGSNAQMERVNEAYRILSSPVARRDYDNRTASARPQPTRPTTTTTTTVRREPSRHTDHSRESARENERVLNRWARARGFALLQRSILFAVPLVPITRYFAGHTAAPSAKYIFSILGFAPVYGVIIALVWLVDPGVRISLERVRLGKGYRHLSDFLVALGLTVAFVPILLLWVASTGV